MAKVQVGFKFRPEVDVRLKELAQIWNTTRTAWLEEMIMSFDLESEREAAEEGRSEVLPPEPKVYGEPPGGRALNPPPLDVTPSARKKATKASAKKGKAEGERLVERAQAGEATATAAWLDDVHKPGVRRQVIPKPRWKK